MKLGSEVFLQTYTQKYQEARIGLMSNLTGVNHNLESTIDLFAHHDDIQLTALYGPEHGIRGDAKEGELIDSSIDAYTGLPVFSLYNKNKKPDKEMLASIDLIFCDLQDVGVRYYTFIYTLANMMKLCGEQGIPIVVLDRPNPINGVGIEGNIVEDGFESFVGQFPIPVRHGLTIGELALLFKHEFQIPCNLDVIPMSGWSRKDYFDDTDLYWVSPTPNATNLNMCLLYSGTCLLEGTNISEGRGTTKPFEMLGAPFVNGRELAEELAEYNIEGVLFRPTFFKPQYQKYAGKVCEGVQIHITDRTKINAFYLGITVIKTMHNLYPNEFQFTKSADFNNRFFLDLLAGTDNLRKQVLKGDTSEFFNRMSYETEAFRLSREKYLLY
ncbi:DUF1343 domain-containing protein [Virgibacillus siamensis]|uniref:DUF1343 domain-containing protein n=1 Tax=Virgibacillus siamensis TaxID=480071 RepID=A0ABN1FG36_9BACI